MIPGVPMALPPEPTVEMRIGEAAWSNDLPQIIDEDTHDDDYALANALSVIDPPTSDQWRAGWADGGKRWPR